MSTIKLRRSTTQGSIPTTSALADGEVALNIYDGKLHFKKSPNGVASIVTLQPYSGGTGINVDSSTGLISTKQDISTTATPTFAGLTINGAVYDSTGSLGSAGQVLTTDGSGTVAWTTVSGGSGGSAFSVNYTSQTLTKTQQAQARINVGLDDATIYFLSYMFG